MTPPHLSIIDLDRTAFNTHRFSHDLTALIEREFGLPHESFQSGIKHYSHPGELGYDFYNHVQAATGQSITQINQLIATHLGDHDYTYPDVEPWLARHNSDNEPIIIVTVGETNYQELKLRHAGRLNRLPAIIVRQNKGRLLRTGQLDLSRFNYRSTTLIDDNPKTFEELGPLETVQQIYISRPGEKFANLPIPPHVTTVTSFGDLP